jgi:DNA-binding LacI/PurR family transcriptional regulator
MANIREVARQAGVSIKTVSRVINNSPEVAAETRARVRQVIDTLGYRPNLLARGLVNGKTNTVGVVIHHSSHEVFSYPVFGDALNGIANVLSDHDLDLLLNLAWAKRPYVDAFRQQRVDGLILMSLPLGDENLAGLVSSGAPFVSTCQVFEDGTQTSWVDLDFYDGTTQALEYLIGNGHRRIALIAGPPDLASARSRERAYVEALSRHNIPVSPELIMRGPLFEGTGRRLAQAMVSQQPLPTAVVCSDDLVALEVLEQFHWLGLNVPGQISVIGCDDASFARHATPALTTLRQDSFQKGYLAATTLIQLIESSDEPPAPTQTLLPMELIIRDSSGPVPA